MRRTAWGVRQRAAGVLSALLLGVVTLVSPAPASALGVTGVAAAAASPVQRTLPQQTDRPARSERTSAGAPTRVASTGIWAPERTRQHPPPQPDSGALPAPSVLPVPRAVVACGAPAGFAAPATGPSGLPDVRGPPRGSSHPHYPVPAPVHRPR
ncbi:hypothetical protein ACGFMO_08990 [Streptomyces niveus]|uniref:hypothetical protein n=1 Tax=Streptomyces niveus TaxID=193462 RepID=UPI00371EDB57